MTEFEATCRGPNCRAGILMVTYDPTRKPHPYNRTPITCSKCKGKGKIANLQADLFDQGAARELMCPKCHGEGKVRQSHFQTCPDAESFRPKKKAGI